MTRATTSVCNISVSLLLIQIKSKYSNWRGLETPKRKMRNPNTRRGDMKQANL